MAHHLFASFVVHWARESVGGFAWYVEFVLDGVVWKQQRDCPKCWRRRVADLGVFWSSVWCAMCTAACGLVMVTRTRSPLSLSRDSDATGGISRVFWTVLEHFQVRAAAVARRLRSTRRPLEITTSVPDATSSRDQVTEEIQWRSSRMNLPRECGFEHPHCSGAMRG